MQQFLGLSRPCGMVMVVDFRTEDGRRLRGTWRDLGRQINDCHCLPFESPERLGWKGAQHVAEVVFCDCCDCSLGTREDQRVVSRGQVPGVVFTDGILLSGRLPPPVSAFLQVRTGRWCGSCTDPHAR